MKSFKIPLDLDIDKLLYHSTSQAGQDLFVVAMTGGKCKGTYLEIGAWHPIISNNTFLLELMFEYSGLAIDQYHEFELPLHFPHFANQKIPLWKEVRPRSRFIVNDARKVDYSSFERYYDYLSFDLDDPSLSWDVIKKIIEFIEFSAITFEHESINRESKESKMLKNKVFNLLSRNGYRLLVDNVAIPPGKLARYNLSKNITRPIYFEDWYVNPKYIESIVIDTYTYVTLDLTIKYYTDILFDK